MRMCKHVIGLLIALALTQLVGCGIYNGTQVRDENVAAAEAKMLSVAKQRADLVGNAVAVVQRYAKHEKETFTEIATARAGAGKVNITGPQEMQAYLQAQNQMTGALTKLMAVAENYPQLKADQGFLTLQKDLTHLNMKVDRARQDYIDTIAAYNKGISVFPANLMASMFGWQKKPQYKVMEEAEAREAPKVTFDS